MTQGSVAPARGTFAVCRAGRGGATFGAMTSPSDIRNVAVIGHKGCGKTSLVEAMLYVAKATPKLGRVDDKSSVLDDTVEEREHLSSLEASVACLTWNGAKVNVIDTPGEGSFLAETRLALRAVDAVLLTVSAKDGVQPITERVFSWARDEGLPVLVVVTKVDAENASPLDAAADVKTRLKVPTALLELCVGEGHAHEGVIALRTNRAFVGKPDAPGAKADAAGSHQKAAEAGRARLVDDVAGTDDDLTETYLTEGDLTQAQLDDGLRRAIAAGKLCPVYFASGTRPSGITALLDAVVELVPPPTSKKTVHGLAGDEHVERPTTPEQPLAAYVFKTSIDPHAGRSSWARVLTGTLKHDTPVHNASTGQSERVGKLSVGLGKDQKHVDEAPAGDIVAIGKLKATFSGQTLCDEKRPFRVEPPRLPPALFSRGVRLDAKGGEEKVASALYRLTEEDPGLTVTQEESTRELVVAGLGALHLEITVERIRRRTGLDCRLGPPHIAYKETITRKVTNVEGKHKKQTGGHGQFGVCYIDVEPLPRGAGFAFEDAVVGGAIPRQFIPSVEKGVQKAMARGFLAGFPMVDVKVRVFEGKYHDVDSSDAAFQLAGSKAFKQAAAQAGAVLLEPVVKMTVSIPGAATGDVIGDLNSRRGRILGTDSADDLTLISAFVPLSEILEYESKLKSLTQGKGTFSMAIDHLDVCPPHVQDKVIKDSGFKHADDDE